MASKDKAGITKIRKKINKELQKTSSQIESLIGEALRQIEGLQQQIQEPVKKLITDLEKIREREMKRFHDEFDRRMTELHDAQAMLMERIGLSSSSAQNEAKRLVTDDQKAPTAGSAAKTSATLESTKSGPTRKSSGAGRTASGTAKTPTAARKNTKTAGTTASKNAPSKTARETTASSTGRATPVAAKSATQSAAKRPATTKPATQSARTQSVTTPTTARKPASASKATSPASSETGELGRIKGIGPATARKLKDKGITRVQQIANPSEAEQKALEQTANAKTRSNWQRDARSQVSGSSKP